jgi:hypothetical protein
MPEQHHHAGQDMFVPSCRGILAGAITFVVPLIILALVGWALTILLPDQWFNTATLPLLDADKTDLQLFAVDINGRVNFSIWSAVVWIAAAVGIGLAYVVLRHTLNTKAAILGLAIALAVGWAIGIYFSRSNYVPCKKPSGAIPASISLDVGKGFREVVIDNIMCRFELANSPTATVLVKTETMIEANTLIGFVGAAAVMAAFAGLAMWNKTGPDVVRLRRRLDDFRTLTLMGSVLFVLNALVTRSLVTWVQGMIASSDDVEHFSPLSNALLNGWAAESSAVFFAVIAFAAVFLYCQIQWAAEAERTKAGGAFDETKWKADSGLTFETTTVITTTIGTIAPVLAAPAADLISKMVH